MIYLKRCKRSRVSTFLRGCNQTHGKNYTGQLNQSTINGAKIKQFFTKPKIHLLLPIETLYS